MSHEAFGFGHDFDDRANGLQSHRRQTLEGYLLHKRIERHPTVLAGIAAGWQGVIGTGGIVAHRFGGKVAQEHRARIRYLGSQGFGIVGGQNKVLGRVLVRKSQHGGRIGQQNGAAVFEGLGRDLAAGQRFELGSYFGLHLFQQLARIAEHDDLRVDPVLGLRKQVGSHEGRIGAAIGNHQHFRRSGGHIDGHAKLGGGQLLGRRHVAVARAKNLVDCRHAGRTQGQGGYRLRAAGFNDFGDAQ